GSTILEEVFAEDQLKIATPSLDSTSVPFLDEFLRASERKQFEIFPRLTREQIGSRFQSRVQGFQALVARIGVGPTTDGLLTMYRPPDERPFRKRDGDGLYSLAVQLSAAISGEELNKSREDEVARSRARQTRIVQIIQTFDSATDEAAVYRALQNALFEELSPAIPGETDGLKGSVRRIERGTNSTARALTARGFQIEGRAPALSLEEREISSVARVVWDATTEWMPDLDFRRDGDRYVFLNKKIRSGLTVP